MTDELQALRDGRAFAELSAWRTVVCRGSDAPKWLNDLLTAEILELREGQARRALLLTPTGRIRADITVTGFREGFLLLQDPAQPEAIHLLLDRYVLSSDVELEDRSSLALVAFPGRTMVPAEGTWASAPSVLGRGHDLLGPIETLSATKERAGAEGLVEVGPDALDAWRIENGVARFPVDLTPDSLPHEAGLERDIDPIKGCFLGQEAVAKVRNLGHPPFLVVAGRADGPVLAGDPVVVDGDRAGTVTSVAPDVETETPVLVRIRWAAREAMLRTESGAQITRLGPASD